jgi:class 3 adenylate cyclase
LQGSDRERLWRLESIIEQYGGRIERYMGDSVLAYFGNTNGLERARACRSRSVDIVGVHNRPSRIA